MTALYIILGIIAFFVIVLSIPVVLDLEYTDAVRVRFHGFSLNSTFIRSLKKRRRKKSRKRKRRRRNPKRRRKKSPNKKKRISSKPSIIIRAYREFSNFSTTALRRLKDFR